MLQATVGFMPQMTWLQVITWVLYVVIVGAFFIRGARRGRPASVSRTATAATPLAAAQDAPQPVRAAAADISSLPQGAA